MASSPVEDLYHRVVLGPWDLRSDSGPPRGRKDQSETSVEEKGAPAVPHKGKVGVFLGSPEECVFFPTSKVRLESLSSLPHSKRTSVTRFRVQKYRTPGTEVGGLETGIRSGVIKPFPLPWLSLSSRVGLPEEGRSLP